MRYIVSAGGTGGHIYPALAIIDKIKQMDKKAQILYIGTTDRMEKDIIPNIKVIIKTIQKTLTGITKLQYGNKYPINKSAIIKPKYKVQDLGLFSFIIMFFFFMRQKQKLMAIDLTLTVNNTNIKA